MGVINLNKIDKYCVNELIFYQDNINLFKSHFFIYLWVFLRKKHIKKGKIKNGEFNN